MKIDIKSLSFIEIKIDISSIEDHFKKNSNEVKELDKKIKEETTKYIKENDLDEIERDVEYQIADFNLEEIYPKVYWYPFIISVWSILESSYLKLATEISKELKLSDNINATNGGIFKKIETYYPSKLKMHYAPKNINWDDILYLYLLRNTIAHCNGRLDRARARDVNKIKKDIHKYEIEIINDCLIISDDYIKNQIQNVKKITNYLIDNYNEIKFMKE